MVLCSEPEDPAPELRVPPLCHLPVGALADHHARHGQQRRGQQQRGQQQRRHTPHTFSKLKQACTMYIQEQQSKNIGYHIIFFNIDKHEIVNNKKIPDREDIKKLLQSNIFLKAPSHQLRIA